MVSARRLYSRLDRWTRDLSREQYAAFSGIVSFVTYLAVAGIFLGELPVLSAVVTGLTIGVVFYMMRPRQFNSS